MKAILYLLSFSLLTASLTIAQTPKHTQVYVRGGIGGSRATGGQISSEGVVLLGTSSTDGAIPINVGGSQWLCVGSTGVGVTIPVSQQFSIRTEVNVEQKGSAQKITTASNGIYCDPAACIISSASGQFSSRLTYLTMPLLVSYHLRKLSLAAGSYVGYKVSELGQGTFTYSKSAYNQPISS